MERFGTNHARKRWTDTVVLKIAAWWSRHDTLMLRFAAAAMAFVAVIWLGYQFFRFLWQPDQIGGYKVWPGAIDLKLLYGDVHSWFAGTPTVSVYPPATHPILWLFLGWLEISEAILLWAVTTVGALGWLVFLIVKESGATTPTERVFVALMPLSMYATGATIGNGQLIVHTLPVLVAGILLLRQKGNGWSKDLKISFLMIVSLVKPSIAAPFFWIVLFAPGTLRPAALTCLGYAILTFFAGSFQDAGTFVLLQEWLAKGSQLAVTSKHGTANVHIWLAALGLGTWILPVSLVLFLALGFWTYHHRRVDLWLLMGITAIIARYWSHHHWYDDLLILLPMVALFRAAKRGSSPSGTKVLAGGLLAIMLMAMMAPGGLYFFPPPWNTIYVSGQIIVWTGTLMFLADHARRKTGEIDGSHIL